MKEYLLFMHNDAPDGGKPRPQAEWTEYFDRLNAEHVFEGGSSIGGGLCVNIDGKSRTITSPIYGYIRLRVRDLDQARELAAQNPVYKAGGTIEIRELD